MYCILDGDRESQSVAVEHPPATPTRGFQAANRHREDTETPGARGIGLGAEGGTAALAPLTPATVRSFRNFLSRTSRLCCLSSNRCHRNQS